MENDFDIFQKKYDKKKKKHTHPICVFIPNSKGGEEADKYMKTLKGAQKEYLVKSDISILETTYITKKSKSQYNDISHNHK